MNQLWRAAMAASLLGCVVLAGCSGSGGGTAVTPAADGQLRAGTNIARALPLQSPSPAPTPNAVAQDAACMAASGHHCHIEKNRNFTANPDPHAASIVGLTPQDLHSAYNVPAAVASRKLIAIVDAYDDQWAESDMAVYRARFGLPPCTSLTGCFAKYKQGGDKFELVKPPKDVPKLPDHPSDTANWSDEIALDLAMASAACPTCRIALFEAHASDIASLSAGVKAAAALHPAAISNSYGVAEATLSIVPTGTKIDDHSTGQSVTTDQVAAYSQPGIAVVASTGDSGVTEFPASLPNVIAVGGTSLSRSANSARGWEEQLWRAAGRGCSSLFASPAWQSSVLSGCATRAVADISFAADLNPGIAVYSSADGGWMALGGTSAGSPFVAGLIAAAGDYGSASGASALWAQVSALNDVGTRGNRFATLGSPNGLAGL